MGKVFGDETFITQIGLGSFVVYLYHGVFGSLLGLAVFHHPWG